MVKIWFIDYLELVKDLNCFLGENYDFSVMGHLMV